MGCPYPFSLYLPSLRWGSGLKHGQSDALASGFQISPHFGGGSGLKQDRQQYQHDHGADISPHFGGGSGLKRVNSRSSEDGVVSISPHFGGGSGLKLISSCVISSSLSISPHFGGGSGLKHLYIVLSRWHIVNLPSLRWGERIETSSAS